jgi:hypothetical protein
MRKDPGCDPAKILNPRILSAKYCGERTSIAALRRCFIEFSRPGTDLDQ